MRRWACFVSVILAILLFSPIFFGQPIAPKHAGPAILRNQALPAGVPADWWSQVQANIQKEEYNITWQERTVLPDGRAAYQAPNRTQGFRTYFTEDGIRLSPLEKDEAKWEWELSLVPRPIAGSH